ncbi:multicopper oxidase family protein [Curvivirga sp.]|uniref:multicopper oxidase family protein n=1 Tax=Curvivirga sp. TaxID=2856848 RepID=UPI003B58FA16
MYSRRQILKGSLYGMGAAAVGSGIPLTSELMASTPRVDFVAQHISHKLGANDIETKNMYSFGPTIPPTIRMKRGEEFHGRLINNLEEPTTIHWHGFRLPNNMDGVAYLTQPYVYMGDSFDYKFVPHDAGTYWYHPHCNSLDQLSYGMTGMIIVEEDEDPGFDQDIPINLRDFRLGGDGQFIKLYQPRKTARAGTFGTMRTTNWMSEPTYEAQAGSLVRLRLCVTDVTRIYKLSLPKDAEAKVIAVDGHPCDPFPLRHFAMGPGQRADVAVRVPDVEGTEVAITNYSSNNPWDVVKIKAKGQSVKRDLAEIGALPDNPVPRPDLSNAEYIPMEFSAAAEKAAVPNPICGGLGFKFWAINTSVWQKDGAGDPNEPIKVLQKNKSYVFEFINRTPHTHPIHIHGMTFQILKSNKREVAPWWTDTALVLPDEKMQVALKPDTEGDWLIHCHILEHQKSGMTAFMRVE